ncbi:flagellar filament outer layer protein FlaA [Spirochaeta cellobiosiphila]|uniref:flagellar filament outer layer protein FlaA n=1 Tax=Spirochaeta cellobiosiphila TaxID=504483 RepID=UPI000419506F|nr:flagellar filament outer layer protein FlaA [Spirochaeta cellobiosiphila]
MKRFYLILVSVFLLLSGMAFAEESVLIDFAELVADDTGEHQPTVTDYSTVAGSSYTDEEKAEMKISLAIENWEVDLASSSAFIDNQANSLIKEAPVSETSKMYAGSTVMGVRIKFPEEAFNSWAMIVPPFTIPAYATDENTEGAERGEKFTGFGVVKNVGVLKNLTISVLGRNFPHKLSVVLENEDGEDEILPIASLEFDGWRTLSWSNPNYVNQVRNRELYTRPLYPKTSPLVKLKGILIQRDAADDGGDFVTYVKDIKVTYDKAVLDLETDVDDESVWGILDQKESERRKAEMQRLGNLQVLRYLEQKKMDQSADEDPNAAETPTQTP